MFKTLKYLLLSSLYKRAKKSFTMLFVYIVSLILISLIMNDIIAVSGGGFVYIFLMIKWIVILTLLGLIGFTLLKIFNVIKNPFEREQKDIKVALSDSKKEHILSLDELVSKSDSIINRYIKD